MRFVINRRSGAVTPRSLAALGVLAVFVLLVAVLVPRPARPVRPGAPAAPLVETARTNLVLQSGHLHLAGSAMPFSGIMVEHYRGGGLLSRSAVTNGVLHGISQGWHTNGQLQVTEQFKEGVSDGLRTKWYASAAKLSEAAIVGGKLQGTFRRWHENGTLSEQAEFVADQPEGLSLSYFPSGFLKARVVMKEGKPVEQAFFKDGERKE